MKNIVIYTDKNSSNFAEVVSSIEDSNVRLENASNLKDYETLNPGVIIIESVPDIKDVLMVTKFKQPILFIGETFKGCTVRAVAFDYVKTPVDKGIGNKTQNNVEPVKIDEFKRFYIRFGYSIDSRSTTTRRTLSTTEIVKQFVKAPTCFIAFETKEDLKDFEILLKIKTIKVEDKEGKLVDFPDAAKKHLIERVTELSKYWISRNSK